MNTSIEHLPDNKQKELNLLTHILQHSKDVEMVILFGSYARDTWVEDLYVEKGITYTYKSDFDILVVTTREDRKSNFKIRKKIEGKIEEVMKTPVGLIFHSIKAFNHALSYGSYFFRDIKNEGIVLYNSEKFSLQEPRQLTPKESQQKAQDYFNQWYKSANMFFNGFKTDFEHGKKDADYLKKAAFELHQATERYYTTILLVYTDYRPKEHDLHRLSIQVKRCDKRFNVFQRTTPKEEKLFELLRRAYIDTRYRMDEYYITETELLYLADRVQTLQQLTEELCEKRIRAIGKKDVD